MESASDPAIEWGWQRLAALVAGLVAVLGGAGPKGWIARAVWRVAARRVRLAEALARRLVLLLSAGVALSPRKPSPQSGANPPLKTARPHAAYTRFRYGDALPDPYACLRDGPVSIPSSPGAAEHVAAGGLVFRLSALQAVLAAPLKYARKMKARLTGRLARRAVLRPGRPPGLGRDLYDLDTSALSEMHDRALDVLNRSP